MPNRCACDSSLCARLFHTAICLALPATLMWKNTSLRHWFIEGHVNGYSVLFVGLWLVSHLLYYITCLTDPGYVDRHKYKLRRGLLEEMEEGEGQRQSFINEEVSDDHEDEDNGDDNECKLLERKVKRRYCDSCEIMQPMRSKHCSDCDRCVRKYDHHCPWLGACIGERNHKFFWSFLLVTAVLIAWTAAITAKGFVWSVSWSGWFSANLLLIIDMVIFVVMGFVVISLWGFHSYLMVKGETTWEVSSRERITYLKYLDGEYNPFNEGCFRNIYIFLCNFTEKHWELLYSIKAKFKKSGSVFR